MKVPHPHPTNKLIKICWPPNFSGPLKRDSHSLESGTSLTNFSTPPPLVKESSQKFTSVQTCRGLSCSSEGGRPAGREAGQEGGRAGNRRASPQRDTAVQTNELATVLLSCGTGMKLKFWGFLQRQTLDQSHGLILLGLHSPEKLI